MLSISADRFYIVARPLLRLEWVASDGYAITRRKAARNAWYWAVNFRRARPALLKAIL